VSKKNTARECFLDDRIVGTILTDLPVTQNTHRLRKKTTAKHPNPTTKVYIKYRALLRANFVSDRSSSLTLSAPPMVLSCAVAVPGTRVGATAGPLAVDDDEDEDDVAAPPSGVACSLLLLLVVLLLLLVVLLLLLLAPLLAAEAFVGPDVGTGDLVTKSSGTDGATNLFVGWLVGCLVAAAAAAACKSCRCVDDDAGVAAAAPSLSLLHRVADSTSSSTDSTVTVTPRRRRTIIL
jgi:hypothetical protein